MNKSKTTLFLFLGILIIKVLSVFLMNGPTIFPDEACVVQIATHFSQNFNLASCAEITNRPAQSPFPLYSILISTIYNFWHGMSAYYAVLILNALMVSSLVFPLKTIFKKFIKNQKSLHFTIFFTLFIPAITSYEKTLMTETIFLVLSIWSLGTYIDYQTTKSKNKLISTFTLAIIASLSRPFGFILPLSFSINELAKQKGKTRIKYAIISFIFLIGAVVLMQYLLPGIFSNLQYKITSLGENKGLTNLLTAFVNQINSFTSTLFIVPVLCLLTNLNNKKIKALQDVKYFLISFIALNILISTQHIYGYFLEGSALNLLTRYINVSIIFIFIFFIATINNTKEIFKKTHGQVFVIVSLISILHMGFVGKQAQNVDLSFLYQVIPPWEATISQLTPYIIIGVCILVIGIFHFLTRKNATKFYITITLIISVLNITWIAKFPHQSAIIDFFENTKNKTITYLLHPNYNELTHYWKLRALTNNEIDWTKTNLKNLQNYNFTSDYYITNAELPLEKVAESMIEVTTPQNKKENQMILIYKNSN